LESSASRALTKIVSFRCAGIDSIGSAIRLSITSTPERNVDLSTDDFVDPSSDAQRRRVGVLQCDDAEEKDL